MKHTEQVIFGTLCGLVSAVGYTAANIFLRAAADCDPIWVSAVKALPTMLFVGPWLLVRAWRGVEIFPDRKAIGILVVAGLVGQLGGNVLFQWSLGIIGIALTVPLCLGTIILGGGILGRMFLHEPLTCRTLLSIVVLIVAIAVLSLGADDAHLSIVGDSITANSSVNWWIVAQGVAAASLSGMAYAILGVVIRYGVTGRTSVSTTLFTISLAGIISLGAWSFWRIGWDGMLETEPRDLQIMLLAGLFNAIAFLAITKAFQLASVVYVNALNATQAAMAAVAGILFFNEAESTELGLGVALTVVGLLLMEVGERPK